MPTDRFGNKLTWKEFFSRWKKGIEGVTALQQTKMQFLSTIIILIGIICGIVITLFALETVWWLTIILVGALFNTLTQLLGLWQKKQLLSRFNTPLQKEGEKITGEVGNFPTSFSKKNYKGGQK
jgi:protein-S-isoprenylcysteine O-methyltransferase Ste14